MNKLICKMFGHKMKPWRAYPSSSYVCERCDRCNEFGKTIQSEKDNREALRTTPFIAKKNIQP